MSMETFPECLSRAILVGTILAGRFRAAQRAGNNDNDNDQHIYIYIYTYIHIHIHIIYKCGRGPRSASHRLLEQLVRTLEYIVLHHIILYYSIV